MKETFYSINGFTLINHKKLIGREGEGYQVKLTYQGKTVCVVTDYGDGGCELVDSVTNASETIETLCQSVRSICDELHPETMQSQTSHDCMASMVLMLLELKESVSLLRRYFKKYPQDCNLALMVYGDGIFRNDMNCSVSIIRAAPVTRQSQISLEEQRKYLQEALELLAAGDADSDVGLLSSFYICNKTQLLNLTTEEYIQMNRPSVLLYDRLSKTEESKAETRAKT